MQIETLVNQLTIAKEFYYKGKPLMSDQEFDKLEQMLFELDRTHKYFNSVGTTAERGHKIKHQIPMGSLDLVDVDQAMKFIKNGVIASHKEDGNSIALYYDHQGNFESAVTRGDGIEGLDVTRHFNRILKSSENSFPNKIEYPSSDTHNRLAVRAEVIFDKEKFKDLVVGYKNPRNYVAGQLNRSVADDVFIDNVSIVAFDMQYEISHNLDRIEELNLLIDYGFETVPFEFVDGKVDLEELLKEFKNNSPYELDGIVLEYIKRDEREALGYTNLNPNFAKKFKINVDFVETEVIKVEWNASKDAYLKPRVELEPIDLGGVTISFATGFNAKFILDNKIGKGAIVQITRAGDVIPKIEKVITSTFAEMPENYADVAHWSETGVDLILNEKPDESVIKEIVDFFTSIDAPLLKIGSVTSLFEAGFCSISSIIKMTEDEMIVVLGVNGSKAFVGLQDALQGIDEYKLAGALPFFGRGVGSRKLKTLAEAFGDLTTLSYNDVINTNGFEEITAVKISNAIPLYIDFLEEHANYVTVKKYMKVDGDLNGIQVCFTGVRDSSLENSIISRGGKVLSSATKQMTHLVAKDINSGSSKLKKAKDNGVEIINLEEAKARWS